MTDDQIVRGSWYPNQPPMLPGENLDSYTDRLTGADRSGRRPFDHNRYRQCSIGWHNECSDRENHGAIDKKSGCGCPCHEWRMFAAERAWAWNHEHLIGTLVSFGDRVEDEPDVRTASPAWVEGQYPVVELEGFTRPVSLSWVRAAPA